MPYRPAASSLVAVAPAVAGRNTIQPTGDFPALVVKASVGQTADLLQVKDSGAGLKALFNANGQLWTSRISVGANGTVSSVATLFTQGNSTSDIPLVVRAVASQSSNLQEWQDPTTALVARVSSTGGIVTGNGFYWSAAATAQTTDSSMTRLAAGAVQFAGTGSSTDTRFVVKALSGQAANLQEWQDSTGAVKARVNSQGALVVANVNDPNVLINPSGTTSKGMIVKAPASYATDFIQFQDSTAAVLAGVSQAGGFYTANRITAGVGSVQTWGVLNVGTVSAGLVGIAVRGSVSQTGNLQEWQDSTGAILSRVDQVGNLSYRRAFNGVDLGAILAASPGAAQIGVAVRGAVSQASNLQEWQDSTTAVLANVSPTGAIRGPSFGSTAGGAAASISTNGDTGGLVVLTNQAANKGLVIRSATSQSANLQEWQSVTPTTLSFIDTAGQLHTPALLSTAASKAAIFTNSDTGSMTLVTGGSANKGLVLRGAVSQSANYFEVQDSTNALQIAMGTASGGSIAAQGRVSVGSTLAAFQTWGILNVSTVAAGNVGVAVRGVVSQSANLQEWQDSTTAVVASISPAGRLAATGGAGIGTTFTFGAALATQPLTTSTAGLVVRGLSSQTGDLFQAQDVTPTTHFAITAAGLPKWSAATDRQTTVGAAGAASALPATPTKYLKVVDDAGTTLVIPAYAAV